MTGISPVTVIRMRNVMAGLDPAICRGTVLAEMAGSSLAMMIRRRSCSIAPEKRLAP